MNNVIYSKCQICNELVVLQEGKPTLTINIDCQQDDFHQTWNWNLCINCVAGLEDYLDERAKGKENETDE